MPATCAPSVSESVSAKSMDDVLFDFLDLRREQLDFFQIDEPCKRRERLRWRGDWTPVGAKEGGMGVHLERKKSGYPRRER